GWDCSAARPAGVAEGPAPRRYRDRRLAHGGGEARDLSRCLAADSQRGEERRRKYGRYRAGHHRAHYAHGLLARQRFATGRDADELLDRRLHHARSNSRAEGAFSSSTPSAVTP